MRRLLLALLLLLLPGVVSAQTQWQFSNLGAASACAGPVQTNIIGVDLGSNIFGLEGNVLNAYPALGTLVVTGSTFNDRTYQVVGATLAPSPYPQGQTLVQVLPTIPSASGGFGSASSQLGTNCAGVPGGPVGSVQFNETGAFGGTSAFLWNNSAKTLTITPETSTDNIFGPTKSGLLVDISNYGTNDEAGLLVNVRQDTSAVGTRQKTGVYVYGYHAPDNGGEVSGIFSFERGGGNAATFYKGGGSIDGKPAYLDNGFSIEVGGLDHGAAIFSSTGVPGLGGVTNGQVQVVTLGTTGSKGIIVVPLGGVAFDTRAAYEVGNWDIGQSVNAGVQFQVRMNGDLWTQGGVVISNGGLPAASAGPGTLSFPSLAGGGTRHLCVDNSGIVVTC